MSEVDLGQRTETTRSNESESIIGEEKCFGLGLNWISVCLLRVSLRFVSPPTSAQTHLQIDFNWLLMQMID